MHQRETKELEEGAERPVSSDQWYPMSGCFADVYQRKGDAGARMRIYVNRKELEEICGRAGKERGAAGCGRNEPGCSQLLIAGNLSNSQIVFDGYSTLRLMGVELTLNAPFMNQTQRVRHRQPPHPSSVGHAPAK